MTINTFALSALAGIAITGAVVAAPFAAGAEANPNPAPTGPAAPAGAPAVTFAQDEAIAGADPSQPFGADPLVPYGTWTP
jgi:hypothetical protein